MGQKSKSYDKTKGEKSVLETPKERKNVPCLEN